MIDALLKDIRLAFEDDASDAVKRAGASAAQTIAASLGARVPALPSTSSPATAPTPTTVDAMDMILAKIASYLPDDERDSAFAAAAAHKPIDIPLIPIGTSASRG